MRVWKLIGDDTAQRERVALQHVVVNTTFPKFHQYHISQISVSNHKHQLWSAGNNKTPRFQPKRVTFGRERTTPLCTAEREFTEGWAHFHTTTEKD
jgi:hypothetical protein